MSYLDLTEVELFKVTIEFTFDHNNYDIHNDFDCYSIKYEPKEKMILCFKSINGPEELELTFTRPIILNVRFDLEELNKSKILTNFQRVRMLENGVLKDVSETGLKDYLIEFEEGQSIEVLAEKVGLVVKSEKAEE